MPGPFSGVRVLDMGRYISAPFCAALLSDLGAEVIRVEPIGGADDRVVMPVTEDAGALHLHVNRGKRSIALDLKRTESRTILERLIASCDVVLTNMPQSALAKVGLDYDTLKAVNPAVIHTNVTAFGETGPESESIGFDGTGQAMSGAAWLSGWPGQPTRCAASYVDYATAFTAAFATAAALYQRTSTGEGQAVRTSLTGTALTLMNPILIEHAMGARVREATGNRSPIAGPSDMFRTSDGWIMVQIIGRDMFQRWTALVERPDLLDDPRFSDDIRRGENGEALSALMQGWCSRHSSAECLAKLRAARLPGCPVLSPQGALVEPQHVQGGFFDWVDVGLPGKVAPIARSIRMDALPPVPPSGAPQLGAQSREIMEELGFSREEIDGFVVERVVALRDGS